jgi:LL-diaminopimelate aminotransferase
MFDVLEAANAREKSGSYVARMEIGDTSGFINEAIHESIMKNSKCEFRYSASSGEPELIDVIHQTQWKSFSNKFFGISIAPANFLITAALASVSKPGDIVLIPDPGFPTYTLSADFLMLSPRYYEIDDLLNGGMDYIEKLLGGDISRVCGIILNNPNNPTGIAKSGELFQPVIEALERFKIRVIIDETYINLIYDFTKGFIECDSAIRIRSFSKEHCAPGLRTGYALAPKNESKVISDFISLTISCAPKFIQISIAQYLVSAEAASFVTTVKREMESRFAHVVNALGNESLVGIPNSTFYACIKVEDSNLAFDKLLKNNVSTCPGIKFGPNGREYLRISLAGKKSSFNQDLEMLKFGLNSIR